MGYSIAHAYGAAFDNPDLLVCCVVGDGEAETGPLAGSWHSNKFLNPARDGAVLPILHLNGYKIANPTVPGRMTDEELTRLFTGTDTKRISWKGTSRKSMHQLMAHTMDTVLEEIRAIQNAARRGSNGVRRPDMANDHHANTKRMDRAERGGRKAGGRDVACAPGASGGFRVEAGTSENPRRMDEKLQARGAFRREGQIDAGTWPSLRRSGERRMGANPHANGGLLLRDLLMPDFRDYAVEVTKPGT